MQAPSVAPSPSVGSPLLRNVALAAIVLITTCALHAGTLKEFFQNAALDDANNYNPAGLPSSSNDVLLTTPATALTLVGNAGLFNGNVLFLGSLNVTSNATYTIANVNSGSTNIGLSFSGGNSVSGSLGASIYLAGATTTVTIQGPNGGSGSGSLAISGGVGTLNVAQPGATLNISASIGSSVTKTGEGTLNLSGVVSTLGGIIAASGGTMNLLSGGGILNMGVFVDNPNTGPGSTVTLNLHYPVQVRDFRGTLASPATGTNRAILNLVGSTTEFKVVVPMTVPDKSSIYAGEIAGAGSFVYTSRAATSLNFLGNNTYTGTTTIIAGTVRVNGTTSGQGDFLVGGIGSNYFANGTLGGSGTVGLKRDGTIIVGGAVAGEIRPGPESAIGTLHVVTSGTGGVVFGDRSIFSLEIGSAGASDLLAITGGAIDLTSSSDNLDLISLAGAFDGSTYTIATFDQNLAGGTFNTVTGLPSNYRIDYDATSIRLFAVPEPSTVTASLVGFTLLLSGRPRRNPRWTQPPRWPSRT